jgi:hypothetical protein
MATRLDLADAQFIGYCAGKDGRIIDMVETMGLKKSEWMKWKEKYTNTYLTDSEIKEIDDHFNLTFIERLEIVKTR